jgi:hypothetical protein
MFPEAVVGDTYTAMPVISPASSQNREAFISPAPFVAPLPMPAYP